MVNYSEKVPEEKHRILICAISGLSIKNPGNFPNPFYEKGYRINFFEWDNVSNSEGEMVAPDIVLVNKEEDYSIIFECKSGTLDKEQANRYDSVEKEDLVDWGISSQNPQDLTHDISFVCSFKNGGSIKKTFEQWPYSFPVLEVGISAIELIINDFKTDDLNNLFPIEFDFNSIPKFVYPVGKESPEHIIMEQIMQTLMSEMMKNEESEFKITKEMIIKEIFPYWEKIGSDTQKKIRKNFEIVLTKASDNENVGKYIDYDEDTVVFKVPNYQNTRSLQSFRSKGMTFVNSLKKNYTQKRLNEEW